MIVVDLYNGCYNTVTTPDKQFNFIPPNFVQANVNILWDVITYNSPLHVYVNGMYIV